MESAFESEFRVMKDKQEIHEAMVRYCRGVDRCDRDLIASALHPDAVIDTGRSKTTGAEAPDLFVSGVRNAKASMHFAGNEFVEVEGDVAVSETYMLSYLVLTENGKDYTRVRGSRYIDRFERRAGAWKVAERVVLDDWGRYDEVAGSTSHGGSNQGLKAPDDVVYLMRLRAFGGAKQSHGVKS